jgi:hypothetical protein
MTNTLTRKRIKEKEGWWDNLTPPPPPLTTHSLSRQLTAQIILTILYLGLLVEVGRVVYDTSPRRCLKAQNGFPVVSNITRSHMAVLTWVNGLTRKYPKAGLLPCSHNPVRREKKIQERKRQRLVTSAKGRLLFHFSVHFFITVQWVWRKKKKGRTLASGDTEVKTLALKVKVPWCLV